MQPDPASALLNPMSMLPRAGRVEWTGWCPARDAAVQRMRGQGGGRPRLGDAVQAS